jgi:ppGpp synthetase/RelA/SpoT-type nucleotidyltranferase
LDKKESVDDVIGFRILNPWASELHRLVKILETEFEQIQIHIERTEITERNRVIHMYCEFNEIPFEIQFWPSMMYYCFEYEHSRFYKVDHPTHLQKFRAQAVRNQEHELQDLIDDNVLVPYEKNIGITLDVEEHIERC